MDKSKELVEHLAQLSRLDIGSAEHQQMEDSIPKIIDYVAQLKSIKLTDRVDRPIKTENLRRDEVETGHDQAAILEQAPAKTDRFWKVNGVFS